MGANGERWPARPLRVSGGGAGRRDGVSASMRHPRIELVTEPASEGEAAAIVAALEQFLAETAPAPRVTTASPSPWQRAALREGVSRPATLAWGPGSG